MLLPKPTLSNTHCGLILERDKVCVCMFVSKTTASFGCNVIVSFLVDMFTHAHRLHSHTQPTTSCATHGKLNSTENIYAGKQSSLGRMLPTSWKQCLLISPLILDYVLIESRSLVSLSVLLNSVMLPTDRMFRVALSLPRCVWQVDH